LTFECYPFKLFAFFRTSYLSTTAAVSTSFQKKEETTQELTYKERRRSRGASDYGGSKGPSRSGSRPGSRPSSRGASRAVSPSPFDQSATEEDEELRRILEESRSRRNKFNDR